MRNYGLLAIVLVASIAHASDTPSSPSEITSDPFFIDAELSDKVLERWLFKDLIEAIIDSKASVQGVEGGKEALNAAVIRVAYKNPPPHLIAAGSHLDDEFALGYLRMRGSISFDYTDVIENPDKHCTSEDTTEIDIGGNSVLIPRPTYYSLSDNTQDDDIILEYYETNPPRRAPSVVKPSCQIGILKIIGEGPAHNIDAKKVLDDHLKSLPPRMQKAVFLRNFGRDYASFAASEDDKLVILSTIKVKSRILAALTLYPWRSMSDYSESTKTHRTWRDLIIKINSQ